MRNALPSIFRYPRWFITLFMTDIWERFSFFGMQAILVLYAAAPPARGGLGLPLTTAAALFGVYFGAVFLLSLPGGWIGDRILGERRAILWGGVVISLGHFTMALPATAFTAPGLILIAAGTGLLKPNLSSLLSRFYRTEQVAEREAAFSIFYMSIQISALAAPLVTGFLGETINWHLGFGAAGVGMAVGVARFAAGRRGFGTTGERPDKRATMRETRAVARKTALVVGVAGTALGIDVVTGTFSPDHLIVSLGILIILAGPVSYVFLRRRPGVADAERERLDAFLWLFLAAALFWMLVGQSGSLLNLFAERQTDRSVFGLIVPASWFQSATPLFILLIAPLLAFAWLRLGPRAGLRAKFALGMSCAGASFLVMAGAAATAAGGPVSPLWLLVVFFLHACGEVALGPVGISAAAASAPTAFRGQMIGLWWLFSAMGMGLGSQVVRLAETVPPAAYYSSLGLIAIAAAAALTVFGARIGRILAPPAPDPVIRARTGGPPIQPVNR